MRALLLPIALAGLVALLAYLAGTPFTILDFPKWRADFLTQASFVDEGWEGQANSAGRAVPAGTGGRDGLGDAGIVPGRGGRAAQAMPDPRSRAGVLPGRLRLVHAPVGAVLRAVRAADRAVPLPAGRRPSRRHRQHAGSPPICPGGPVRRDAGGRDHRAADLRHSAPQPADCRGRYPRAGGAVGDRERAARRQDAGRGVHHPRPPAARLRRPVWQLDTDLLDVNALRRADPTAPLRGSSRYFMVSSFQQDRFTAGRIRRSASSTTRWRERGGWWRGSRPGQDGEPIPFDLEDLYSPFWGLDRYERPARRSPSTSCRRDRAVDRMNRIFWYQPRPEDLVNPVARATRRSRALRAAP